eukprot:TRINITY_DN3533_c0_g2_i1.p1 TRINITY_DN3533_c0_g2~~TRINITY_DN3533_c0_g2_i1.p1  ORF type:complete len:300 (+),score=49.00 TRINITY_DN3533_c0_g2_i1:203-1102(+)
MTVDKSTQVCDGGPCELFSVFGIFVQAFIGFWCVFVLFVMWRLEEAGKRRSCMTWIGDMTKQMAGAGCMHFLNAFCAVLFGSSLASSSSLSNQCVWYLLVFVSDITLCILLSYLAVRTLRPILLERCDIDIGNYDDAGAAQPLIDEALETERSKATPLSARDGSALVSLGKWALQTAIWVVIVTVVKVVVFFVVFLTQEKLYNVVAWVFAHVGLCGHQNLQLIVSVVVVPVIGDALFFAAQDCFLKRREVGSSDRDSDATEDASRTASSFSSASSLDAFTNTSSGSSSTQSEYEMHARR